MSSSKSATSKSATSKSTSKKADCIRRVANIAKLAKWSKFEDATFDAVRLRAELPTIAPKIHAIISNIKQLDADDIASGQRLHKHFIFSDVTGGYGAKTVVSALIAHGYELVYNKQHAHVESKKSNGVALLASSTVFGKALSAKRRRTILSNYNSRPDNVYGDNIRFIVADGGFKEGVDLFDVKYVHVLEPQVSPADARQVVGRATRNCGQQGLVFTPSIGWQLNVFVYDSVHGVNETRTTLSAEALRAAGIDLARFKFAEQLEHLCKIAAIDTDLTKTVHGNLLLDASDPEQGLTNMDLDIPTPISKLLENGFDARCTMKSIPLSVYMMLFAWQAQPGARVPIRLIKAGVNRRAVLCDLARRSAAYSALIKEMIEVREGAFVLRHLSTVLHNLKTDPNYQLLDSGFKARMHENLRKYASEDMLTDAFFGKGVLRKTDDPTLPARYSTLRKQILRSYGKKFSWPSLPVDNGCVAPHLASSSSSAITLNPSQRFLSTYFRPETDVKGMLLWHSVGTGKTCTAVATASKNFELRGYTILWVTRTTLKKDVLKNLEGSFSCHVGREGRGSGWLPSLSYRQFTNLLLKKNKVYDTLVARNGKEDPLHKTLVIIDEAHKLFGGTDLKKSERPDVARLRSALMESYRVSGSESARLLLMTATPWVHDPMETIQLLNLLREQEEQLPELYASFKKEYLDDTGADFTADGRMQIVAQLAGYISFLDRSRDARQFAQPMIKQIVVDVSDNSVGHKMASELSGQANVARADYARQLEECKVRGAGKRGSIKACKEELKDLEIESKALTAEAKSALKRAKESIDQLTQLRRCLAK